MEGRTMSSKLSINMRRLIIKWRDIDWLITNIKANRKVRKETRLNNQCALEAERRIQYREFNGKLCVALDNVPIIPVTEQQNTVLDDCRELFGSYIYKQRAGYELQRR